jgi:hypothetical protein
LTLLVAASLGVVYPFLTGQIIGGVDGRWYGYVLADYIEQVRHGALLVTAGQGHYAWNGAVHVFRSAPVYMMVARFWNALTLGRLNPFALQHMTVVTSAAAGVLGFYAAAAWLMPGRRWVAAGLAVLYLGTPAWLSTVQYSEAYMSYMAFGAMPLVLYGNARTALDERGSGYPFLGAGLALLWMCHPPIAFITTVATLVLQSLLVVGRGIVSAGSMAAGAAMFVVLDAFYFAGMSELPALPQRNSMSHDLVQMVGFALFVAGAGRFALVPRRLGWLAVSLAGAGAVAVTSGPWLHWAAATAALWACTSAAGRALRRVDLERHAVPAMFLCCVGGAAIAEAWVGREGILKPPLVMFADNTAHAGDLIAPLVGSVRSWQVYQPGFGLLAAIACCASALFGRRPAGAKALFAVCLGLVICFVRIPLASNFLLGRFPPDLISMCGAPLALRIMPVIASFAAIGAVAWFATAPAQSGMRRLGPCAALVVLVAWNACQVRPFNQHSRDMTNSTGQTALFLRPESTMIDAYDYQLLKMPDYYSNGMTDPRIESRLHDSSGRIVVDPDREAIAAEKHGQRILRTTTGPMENTTAWFEVLPRLTVQPGESLLLRYEFEPSMHYDGYFIVEAKDAYREYHLPSSGQRESFGVGEGHQSVLSLWNTGDRPETYKFSVSTEAGNDIPHMGGFFAVVHVSRLDPSFLPVALESLSPYRARVDAREPGTLETIRSYVPGYKATVDGAPAAVLESQQHLVTVAVPAGVHEVEVRMVGTLRIWTAAAISAAAWLLFLAWALATTWRLARSGAGASP